MFYCDIAILLNAAIPVLSIKNRILFLLFFLLLSILLLISNHYSIRFITFLSLCLSYPLSRYLKKLRPIHNSLEIIFIYFALSYLLGFSRVDKYFPADLVIILCLLLAFLLLVKKIDRSLLFLKINWGKNPFWIVLLISFVSIVTLAVWFFFQKGNPYAKYLPKGSLYFLIPMGFGFAAVNACYEECLFRSFLLTQFADQIGFSLAICLQAIWFSFLHFQNGFPSGVIGIFLTFIFGLILGYVAKQNKSISVPVIIHFFADLSIFFLIVFRAKAFLL